MTKPIQVFEYGRLKIGENGFTAEMHKTLVQHYGEGKDYYSLIHNGVRFNQYVGVLQVAEMTIEVLPKVDKLREQKSKNQPQVNDEAADKHYWQQKLIDMLLVVNQLQTKISSDAQLKLKNNAILDVYFSLFLNEIDTLLHKGLMKQYHKQQGNLPALKGRLNFSQHISQNIIHKERFFVEYTVYDRHNNYNQILYKTLKLISQLNQNPHLTNRINQVLFHFPEMDDLVVNNQTFERLTLTRKNQHYQTALSIAELILLNYHPDITQGKRSVLALMFDMNQLWERFVFNSLQRYKNNPDIRINAQLSKSFWQSSQHGSKAITMKADIVINHQGQSYVLDTKWKCPNQQQPSAEDLRQLYAYHHYYTANKVALVYPALTEIDAIHGNYVSIDKSAPIKSCSLLFMPLSATDNNIVEWQRNISQTLLNWCKI